MWDFNESSFLGSVETGVCKQIKWEEIHITDFCSKVNY